MIYLLERVKNTIKLNNLINDDDRVLVALSGGCDSVCLCLVLKALGIDFAAAHLNHSIREEADFDEQFVKEFARRHNFEIYVKKVNIPLIAQNDKVSLETAGRNERYKFFREISDKFGYTKVAVAHNKNDVAETFFMNLMRGSGLKGLCSIPVSRDNIIRPLIDIERYQIEEFVKTAEESYVTDKSNFSNDYTRNKIRNIIVPEFLKINSNFIDSVSKTTKLLKDDNDFIESVCKNLIVYQDTKAYIDKCELLKYPSSVISRALIKAYEYVAGTSKDFEKKHIDYICEKIKLNENGNIIDLHFDTRCSLRYGKVIFEPKMISCEYEYTLCCGDSVYIPEFDMVFTMTIADKIEFSDNCEYFVLPNPKVKIRSRKDGDALIPFGMNSQKKLKKVMIDKKIDVTLRDKIPVFEYNDDIIWVYGVCRSDLYKVDDNCKVVYKIQGEKNGK